VCPVHARQLRSVFFRISQAKTFDAILDGNDVVGRARTGRYYLVAVECVFVRSLVKVIGARDRSGKTLAFALPVIERLMLIDAESVSTHAYCGHHVSHTCLFVTAVCVAIAKGPRAYGAPPRVLVMCPTRELAKQVRYVCVVVVHARLCVASTVEC
jgi:superfamily II DNA/RNA helicase